MALLRLVRKYFENSHLAPGLPLFVKSHNANLLANDIGLFPLSLTKSIIFIVRDPRDVCPSFAKHLGQSLDKTIEHMNDKYRCLNAPDNHAKVGDFISSWDDHTRSFLENDTHNVLRVRYEDMKADPVGAFTKILEHSGIKPDVERVKKALEMVELSKLQEKEQKEGFLEGSPFNKSFFGGKNEKLSDIQKYKIEKLFGRVMKKVGYMDKRKAA